MYAPLAKVVSLLTPKRRWFQFSLLTMFVVVTAFGVWLGHWVDPVSKLCRQLHDESEDVRLEAAKRLGQMGSQARAAEAALIGAFKDESWHVRCEAAKAVSQIGGDWRALAPLLDDDFVRLSAGKGIIRSGGDIQLVVRKLLDGGELADILQSFGPDPTLAAIPVLIDAVAGHDAALKEMADHFLYKYLPVPPVSAVPLGGPRNSGPYWSRRCAPTTRSCAIAPWTIARRSVRGRPEWFANYRRFSTWTRNY